MKKIVSVLVTLALCLSLGTISPCENNAAKAAAKRLKETVDLSTNFTKTFTLPVDKKSQTVSMPVIFSKNVRSTVKVTMSGATKEGVIEIAKAEDITTENYEFLHELKTSTSTFYMSKSIFAGANSLNLIFLKHKDDMDKEVKITLQVSVTQPTNGGTITAGQSVKCVNGYNMKQYYKFTLPSAGTVKVEPTGLVDVKLCSSSKKELELDSSKSAILNKGTYYLCVEDDGAGTLKYTFKNMKPPKNTSKKKAKKVKLGKKIKENFTLSGNTYWYKYTVKKTKKIKAKIQKGDVAVTADVYNAKGKNIARIIDLGFMIPNKDLASKLKLKKGTYYLKLTSGKGRSGKYSITLK